MKNKNFKKIFKEIKKAKRVAIFAHTEPDFDAISSALAIKLALAKNNIEADYITNEKQNKKAIKFFGENFNITKFDEEKYDFFISVDTPTLSRTMFPNLFNDTTNSFVIDHHKNIDLHGKYNFISTEYSSCAEMVYKFLSDANVKIDKQIASYIYAGLSADTNSFTNNNTNENSFFVASQLKKYGAEINKFNELFYRSISQKEIAIRRFIDNNYKIEKSVVYCITTQEDIKQLKANKNELHISNQLIKLEDAKIAFAIIEKELCEYYVSFRSKDGFPCRDIVEKFGGGGHEYACACKIIDKSRNIEKIKDLILKEVKRKLKNLGE